MAEFSKEEAAKYLGCSPRQIERLTSENRLGVLYVKGRGKPVPRYDEGELARFKAETERIVQKPAVQVLEAGEERQGATQNEVALSLPVASSEQMQALAGHLLTMLLQRVAQGTTQMQGEPSSSTRSDGERHIEQRILSLPIASTKPQALLGEKLTLSLDEATALSGVPRSILRAAIQCGELQAKRIGRGWKVRRDELERWVKETC